MTKLMLYISLVTVMFTSVACWREPVPSTEEVQALQHKLATVESATASAERSEALRQFYEIQGLKPVWIADGKPQARVATLAEFVAQASSHGLETDEYKLIENPTRIEDELQITESVLKLASAVAAKGESVAELTGQAVRDGSLHLLLDRLAPMHPLYSRLRTAIQRANPESPLPDEDFARIQINMKRLRELPRDLGNRYIAVNIPEYRLRVVEGGSEVLAMNVVVGKQETATPVFSEDMTHLVFSPYWNIPESILTNETLPRAIRDQNYLARQNIEIVRVSEGKPEVVDASDVDWSEIEDGSEYRFRQRPGAANSLGLVKFMLPNKFNVYLHDTPADDLFEEAERDFSHGCVRLENPVELARYVLRDQPQWTESKIEAAMHSGDESTVKLKETIPVHIVYFTAWTTPEGNVEFYEDIYNLDHP